ncbi:Protein Aster-B [Phlyctochytrium planicorne]|nr:Protein Aster-B [Phlyctochytrium planicorne]
MLGGAGGPDQSFIANSSNAAWNRPSSPVRQGKVAAAEPILSPSDFKINANQSIPILNLPDDTLSSESARNISFDTETESLLPPPVAPRPEAQKIQNARHRKNNILDPAIFEPGHNSDPEGSSPTEDRFHPRGSPFAILSIQKKASKNAIQPQPSTSSSSPSSPTEDTRTQQSVQRKAPSSPLHSKSKDNTSHLGTSANNAATTTVAAAATLPSPASSSRPESPNQSTASNLPPSPSLVTNSPPAPQVPLKDPSSPAPVPMGIAAWFKQHTGSRSNSPDLKDRSHSPTLQRGMSSPGTSSAPATAPATAPAPASTGAVVNISHPPPAGYLTHSPSFPSLRDEAASSAAVPAAGDAVGKDRGSKGRSSKRAQSLGPYESLRGSRGNASSDSENASFVTAASASSGHGASDSESEARPPSPEDEVKCQCGKHSGTNVCDVILDLPVAVLFEAIFAEGGSPTVHEAHRRRLTSDLKFGEWKQSERGTMTRKITYKYAFKAILVGKISTPCFEDQEITHKTDYWMRGECTSSTPQVPYGTQFHVVNTYCITHAGHGKAHLRVFSRVELSQKLMLADTLASTSADGVSAYCKELVEALKGLVDKRAGEAVASELAAAILTRHHKRKPSGPRPLQSAPSTASASPSRSLLDNELPFAQQQRSLSNLGTAYPTPPGGSPIAANRSGNREVRGNFDGSVGGGNIGAGSIYGNSFESANATAFVDSSGFQREQQNSRNGIGLGIYHQQQPRQQQQQQQHPDELGPRAISSGGYPGGDKPPASTSTAPGADSGDVLLAAARRKSVELVSLLDAAARSVSPPPFLAAATGSNGGGADGNLSRRSSIVFSDVVSAGNGGDQVTSKSAPSTKRRGSDGGVVQVLGPRPMGAAQRRVLDDEGAGGSGDMERERRQGAGKSFGKVEIGSTDILAGLANFWKKSTGFVTTPISSAPLQANQGNNVNFAVNDATPSATSSEVDLDSEIGKTSEAESIGSEGADIESLADPRLPISTFQLQQQAYNFHNVAAGNSNLTSSASTPDRGRKIQAPERSMRPGGSLGLAARLQPTSGPVSTASSPLRGSDSQVGLAENPPLRRRKGPRAHKLLPRPADSEERYNGGERGILDEMDDVGSYMAPSIASSSKTQDSRVKGPRPANLRIRTSDMDLKEKLLTSISEELGVLGSREDADADPPSTASLEIVAPTADPKVANSTAYTSPADLTLSSSAVVEGYISPALPEPSSVSAPSILPGGIKLVPTRRPRNLNDEDTLPLIPLPPSPTATTKATIPIPIPPPRQRKLSTRRLGYRLRLPGHWVKESRPLDEYMAEPARQRWLRALGGSRGPNSLVTVLWLLCHIALVSIAVMDVSFWTLLGWVGFFGGQSLQHLPHYVEICFTSLTFVISFFVGLLPPSVSDPLLKLGAVGVELSWQTWNTSVEMTTNVLAIAYKLLVT